MKTKKWGSVLAVIALAVILCSCGNSSSESGESMDSVTVESDNTMTAPPDTSPIVVDTIDVDTGDLSP